MRLLNLALSVLLPLTLFPKAAKADAKSISYDEAMAPFAQEIQLKSLKKFAAKASHFKNFGALLEKTPHLFSEDVNEFKKMANQQALPKILTTKKGFEFSVEGKKYQVEASSKFYTFKINGSEFSYDPKPSAQETYSQLKTLLGSNGSKGVFSEIFLPSAQAAGSPGNELGALLVMSAVFSTGVDLMARGVGCYSGFVNNPSMDGCKQGANAVMSPGKALGELGVRVKSKLASGRIVCDGTDGSFSVYDNQNEDVFQKPLYSYVFAKKETVHTVIYNPETKDEAKVPVDQLENHFVEIAQAKGLEDPQGRLRKAMSSLKFEVIALKERCRKDPKIFYTWGRGDTEFMAQRIDKNLQLQKDFPVPKEEKSER